MSPIISPSGGGGGGGMLSATVPVSSAQILAIFASPVTLVAAPGAGFTLVAVGGVIKYVPGATPYTDGGGNLRISVATVNYLSHASTGFWDQASAQQLNGSSASGFNLIPNATLTNQPITLNQSAASPTLGNGTLVVTVTYFVASA